jgi:hypothetical protein
LRGVEACKPLFRESPPPVELGQSPGPLVQLQAMGWLQARLFTPRDCSDWFGRRALGELHPSSPTDVWCDQRQRAARLQQCLCRDGNCTGTDPFDPAAYDALFGAAVDPRAAEVLRARADELVCLSWGASILQDKKSARWPLSRALALSTETSVAFGPLEASLLVGDAAKMDEGSCSRDPAAELSSRVSSTQALSQ